LAALPRAVLCLAAAARGLGRLVFAERLADLWLVGFVVLAARPSRDLDTPLRVAELRAPRDGGLDGLARLDDPERFPLLLVTRPLGRVFFRALLLRVRS
jgi:hypothetical protein